MSLEEMLSDEDLLNELAAIIRDAASSHKLSGPAVGSPLRFPNHPASHSTLFDKSSNCSGQSRRPLVAREAVRIMPVLKGVIATRFRRVEATF